MSAPHGHSTLPPALRAAPQGGIATILGRPGDGCAGRSQQPGAAQRRTAITPSPGEGVGRRVVQ